jgi:hypothetical protein
MSQVVDPDAIGQAGLAGELLEPAVEPVRLDRGAVLLGEHEIVVVLAPGPQAPLLDLGGPPSSQHHGGDRGQDDHLGDSGAGLVHLGPVGEHGPVFDLDELLVDRQHAGLQVDGRPGQAQDLAVIPKVWISRPCRNGTMRLGSARLSWSGGVSEGGLEPPRPMRALGPQPPNSRSPGLLRVYRCCSGRRQHRKWRSLTAGGDSVENRSGSVFGSAADVHGYLVWWAFDSAAGSR